jgi:hypothetical protein
VLLVDFGPIGQHDVDVSWPDVPEACVEMPIKPWRSKLALMRAWIPSSACLGCLSSSKRTETHRVIGSG